MIHTCIPSWGRGFSSFEDIDTMESMVIKKFNRLELTQKIHACRD